MRYTLVNGNPVRVTRVEVDGLVTLNPSDSFIDMKGLGYPLITSVCPTTDDTSKKYAESYVLEEGEIVQTWSLVDKTSDEKIADIDQEIAAINAAFEVYKSTPVIYQGRGYLPRWVSEYYNAMMLLPAAAWPMGVSDITGASLEMTQAQFTELFTTLVSVAGAETARVNALLATLNTARNALEE